MVKFTVVQIAIKYNSWLLICWISWWVWTEWTKLHVFWTGIMALITLK